MAESAGATLYYRVILQVQSTYSPDHWIAWEDERSRDLRGVLLLKTTNRQDVIDYLERVDRECGQFYRKDAETFR